MFDLGVDSAVSEQFLEDLQSSIELGSKPHEPSGHYKPSSMNCLRSMYYQALKFPLDEKPDGHMRINLGQAGTDRHERIQKQIIKMKKNGFDCEWLSVRDYLSRYQPNSPLEIKDEEDQIETKCYYPKYNISFKCDGIILYRGDVYILEIKTEGLHKWMGRSGPADGHMNQVSSYSLCLEIPKILFLYENRDSCHKKTFIYVVSDMQRQHIIDRVENCNGYVERLIAPPKCADTRDCYWCKHKTQCKVDK